MSEHERFYCPKCRYPTVVTNTFQEKGAVVRYRHCRMCNANFSTAEAVKDTPRVRSWLGEEKAGRLFPPKPFKYRTIKQQKRATKSTS